jgi:hypothetical protein
VALWRLGDKITRAVGVFVRRQHAPPTLHPSPNNFHNFIGNSASYGVANVAMYGNVDWVSIIASSSMHNVRASNTTCLNDLMDQRGSWLTIIINVAMALTAKGNASRLIVGRNGHFPPIDGERDFPSSLRWMFQGCKFDSN